MDTADVMEALVNRPYEWVRIRAPLRDLPGIAGDLNRTPGFEVTNFGTDVLARWTPTGDGIPTLADIPERPRGFVAPTMKDLEGALAVAAKELAPPVFAETVKPYDPAEPPRASAFRPRKPLVRTAEPTEAQLRAREAFKARRQEASRLKQERLAAKAAAKEQQEQQ